MKIAFLDRDGTIIKDYPDSVWSSIDEPEFIEGSFEALRRIKALGYQIIIVTNQYLIDEGFIRQNDYELFAKKFIDLLSEQDIDVLDVFYCPHSRSSGCKCCKPEVGMIEKAIQKYPSINLASSFFCGDSYCDLELAEKFNLRFFGIELESNNSTKIRSIAEIPKLLV
ncbi:MAG: HAD-IIIA family hydrolase [Streptococcaceae bacterium]|jgi:D-glycero-D-manno-heptose 1,7-bisphosphate phosphatase|nr:HAD-IIIA family hydrolase [Streptococcaceae bacterium]